MKRPGLALLPWVLFLLVIAAWLPGLIYDRTSLEVTGAIDKLWAVSFLAFPMVGVLLTVRLPSNPVGWLFLIGPAFVGAGVSISEYAESTGQQLVRVSDLVLAIGLMAMFASILLFPDGRYPNRWFKWLHLVGIAGFAAVAPVSEDLGFVIAYNCLVPVTALAVRFARGGSLIRRQITGPVVIVVLGLSLIGLNVVIGTLGADDRWGTAIGTVASIILTVGIPVTIGIAITRYRLYEMDRILSRTVTYTVVIILLTAVYFGVIAVLTTVLSSDSPLAVAASTLAAAALFTPSRRRVQGWVDRRFNRSRYDVQQVMDGFTDSLRHEVDDAEVVRGWLGVVAQTMQPSFAGVWIREDL
jgi:hypothetical protein